MFSPACWPRLFSLSLWLSHRTHATDGHNWAMPRETSSLTKSACRVSAVPPPKFLGPLFNRPTEVSADSSNAKRPPERKGTRKSSPPGIGRLPHARKAVGNLARAADEFQRGVSARGESIRAEVAERTDGVQDFVRHVVSGARGNFEKHDGAEEKLFPSRNCVGLSDKEQIALHEENDACVEAIMMLIDSKGWEHVTRKSGVTVVKKFIPPPASLGPGAAGRGADRAGEDEAEGKQDVVDAKAAAKFACVKASGTLDADVIAVYKLFLGNERVHEYNDNCREVEDLEWLSPDTKVTWAASPSYGPFKARDFVTIVHYRTLADGTMVVVNRPVEHERARREKKYVRAEILVASNIMRPNPVDPSKTDIISVTHINPGGIVDSMIGAKIANALCAQAPVKLLRSLEKTANVPATTEGERGVSS